MLGVTSEQALSCTRLFQHLPRQAGRWTGFAGLHSASLNISEASLLLMGFLKTVQKEYSFENK